MTAVRARGWLLAPMIAAMVAVLVLAGGVALALTRAPDPATGGGAPGAVGARTLVLYDTSAYTESAEIYAIQTANLVSHFGDWTAEPVTEYSGGDMSDYDAVVYLGSAYDEPLPAAFLDDVAAGGTPVLWVRDNLWQLLERPDAAGRYGMAWGEYDTAPVEQVRYRDQSLTRDPANESGIARLSITDEARVETLATAVTTDGDTFPWAVRSGNLTYVGEIPYTYMAPGDRYLAFSDLLFDLLAPETPERHRALVRLEDVGPMADPAVLRELADYLHGEQVPFSVAVYPVFADPKGAVTGEPTRVRLQDRPEVVAALEYMQQRGGTLLMHGYTHQYDELDNPYNGVSGEDFEFYRAHVDDDDAVQLDGPVPDDSSRWARARIQAAAAEFQAAGLAVPEVFEFPHYAGSVADYEVVADEFAARYDRGLYFPGVLTGGEPRYDQANGQFLPYLARDVYGSVVVPETLGEVSPTGYNQHAPRTPPDLLANAERTLAVRDGVASFFYHPYLGLEYLRELVDGLREQDYQFVPLDEVTSGQPAAGS